VSLLAEGERATSLTRVMGPIERNANQPNNPSEHAPEIYICCSHFDRFHWDLCIQQQAADCREVMRHFGNVILPNATHCMLQMNPRGAAERLADFFSRHPIEGQP
jgi:hypothetical protein